MPLADPEEARCGLIVRDMLRHGQWLVPHLRGDPYFEKPAPFFWLAALAVRLTGNPELGGRLIPALAGLGAVLIAYAFALRVFRGAYAGLLAGLVLATSGEFLFMARWYRMDMPFAAAMWAALWWFWRSEDRRPAGQPLGKTATWVGFYLFCAVATLFKGPAGMVLPGGVVLGFLLLTRQYRRVLEFLSPAGLAAYFLVAAPWYVAVGIAAPGQGREFFLRQNVQRFLGSGGLGHDWPGILYVPIVLAGMLPWTIFLPGIVMRSFPRRWRVRGERPALLFLWLCALVPLVFFAVSGTKLASYVLPVFAPLAVMVGGLLAAWVASHRPDKLLKLGARALATTVAVLVALPLAIELWLKVPGAWLIVPFGVGLAALCGMLYALRHSRRAQFLGWAIAAVAATFLYLIVHTAPFAYDRMSTRTLAESVDPAELRAGRVCFWSNTRLSFLFYADLDDTWTFHHTRQGDLDMLAEWLGSEQPVYCMVTGPERLAELRRACPEGLRTVAHQGGCWLITNRGDSRLAADAREGPPKRSP